MSQTLRYWIEDEEVIRYLPDAETEVIPGVRWGEPWALFTPAYWLSQFWMHDLDKVEHSPYKARGSLAEEVVFCLLGGFGISAEMSIAAFEACYDAQLIQNLETKPEVWTAVLNRPLHVNGKLQRYRYPNQKSRFLAAAMAALIAKPIENLQGVALRDALLEVDGIGHKIAGWVARNYSDADDVAILDIHLIRAGILCGIFTLNDRVEKDYLSMEARFIEFCSALDVRPAVLDCLIWDQMRGYGSLAIEAVRAIGSGSEKVKNTSKSKKNEVRQPSLF
jgi:thermostable 8-oxoguanine DNA glycosylase